MLERFAEKLRKAEEETPPRPICPPVPERKPPLVVDMVYAPDKPDAEAPISIDAAASCQGYPARCVGCAEYRGTTRRFCRRFHWWKPWPVPETGELPTVVIAGGEIRHVYGDGAERVVGKRKASGG